MADSKNGTTSSKQVSIVVFHLFKMLNVAKVL